tara:strand:+ start:496 stop:672 length:177 start_codon:yes stop_codon:yes gene_type:complete
MSKFKQRLKEIISENYVKVDEIYNKITVIQEYLDSGQVGEAKRELEYLRQELHFKNRR